MQLDAFSEFFSDLHDPANQRKSPIQFFDILFLTVCAVIGGCEGWEDIEDFGQALIAAGSRIRDCFPNGLPVHDTIARKCPAWLPSSFRPVSSSGCKRSTLVPKG